MEGEPQERTRMIPFELAASTFAMQLKLFPNLLSEVTTLTGGSLGILNAIMITVSDEISYTPWEDTTPQRIRTILGAPEDRSQLGEWRANFWDQFKKAHERT